jgi:hypothetical protein
VRINGAVAFDVREEKLWFWRAILVVEAEDSLNIAAQYEFAFRVVLIAVSRWLVRSAEASDTVGVPGARLR